MPDGIRPARAPYRFHATGGVVEFSSCEVAIDGTAEPFTTLEAALAAWTAIL